MSVQEFRSLLDAGLPHLPAEAASKLGRFYELVVSENERQNLTRLISPSDFFEGHILDAWELVKSGLLSASAMDLGSGAGVPGLVAAVLNPQPWILCDSEARKAAFLKEAVKELGLVDVDVIAGRAESYLAKARVGSVVARAVGPVERIYGWLRECSTWNNLVLLKGPSWSDEWQEFQSSKRGRELQIEATHEYSVGSEKKRRLIIRIVRVPRGTIKKTTTD